MGRQISEQLLNSKAFRTWLSEWWKSDYSIKGLEKRSIRLPQQLLRNPIEFGGRSWSPLHCPPIDLEGNPCPEFPSITSGYYSEQSLYNDAINGIIHIDLRGAVLHEISWSSLQIPITVNIEDAAVLGNVFINDAQRSISLLGTNSFLTGDVNISASSKIEVDLSRSHIFGSFNVSATRSSVLILRQARLESQLSVSGDFNAIDASKSIIRGRALFAGLRQLNSFLLKSCSFHQHVEIRDLAVSTEAILSNAKMPKGLAIRDCAFSKGIDANRIQIGEQFQVQSLLDCKSININDSQIKGEINFSGNIGSLFCRNSKLSMMRNSRAVFDKCIISNSTISGFCEFSACNFRQEVDMQGFVANDKLAITECTFGPGILAKGIQCSKKVDFGGTTLGLSCSFRDAVFAGGVSFASRADTFTPSKEPEGSVGRADFRDATFGIIGNGYSAEFSGRQFVGKADFENCTFECPPYFEREAFKEGVSFRLATFKLPKRRLPEYGLFERFHPDVRARSKANARKQDEDVHLAERAYSNLKDAMANAGNVRAERQFHLRELRCRRRRMDSEVGLSEKVVSWLYDTVSDYGESIRKPALWLAGMPLVFAGIFFLVGGSGDANHLPEALEFSAQQIFRPFAIWSSGYYLEVDKLNGWQERFLFWALGPDMNRQLWSLAIRVIASNESILSITVGFLLALSIRRRFQVQ